MTRILSGIPAYRIETERLVVRCYEPSDTPAVHASIGRSRQHLSEFMSWVHREPITFEERLEVICTSRGRFDLGEDFFYGIFSKETQRFVGGTGLHPRHGPDAVEVGYWIDVNEVGKGLATEVAAALTKHAILELGLGRVEIRVEPANVASMRVAEKLGFRREATLARRIPSGTGTPRDVAIWSLFHEELARTEKVHWARYEAFDALGRRYQTRSFGGT